MGSRRSRSGVGVGVCVGGGESTNSLLSRRSGSGQGSSGVLFPPPSMSGRFRWSFNSNSANGSDGDAVVPRILIVEDSKITLKFEVRQYQSINQSINRVLCSCHVCSSIFRSVPSVGRSVGRSVGGTRRVNAPSTFCLHAACPSYYSLTLSHALLFLLSIVSFLSTIVNKSAAPVRERVGAVRVRRASGDRPGHQRKGGARARHQNEQPRSGKRRFFCSFQ